MIRVATVADAPSIAEIQKNGWITAYPNPEKGITVEMLEERFSNMPERIEKWGIYISQKVDNRTCALWVAEQNGTVMGFVAPKIDTDDQRHRVGALYVHEQARGMGLGSALLQKVFQLYRDSFIYLDVVEHNALAVDFYKKHGFAFTDKTSDKFGMRLLEMRSKPPHKQ